MYKCFKLACKLAFPKRKRLFLLIMHLPLCFLKIPLICNFQTVRFREKVSWKRGKCNFYYDYAKSIFSNIVKVHNSKRFQTYMYEWRCICYCVKWKWKISLNQKSSFITRLVCIAYWFWNTWQKGGFATPYCQLPWTQVQSNKQAVIVLVCKKWYPKRFHCSQTSWSSQLTRISEHDLINNLFKCKFSLTSNFTASNKRLSNSFIVPTLFIWLITKHESDFIQLFLQYI